LDRKFVKSDLFEHLLIETGKTAWLPIKAVCLNLLRNVKAENCKELLGCIPDYGLWYVIEESFFTFPLGLLPSEPGSREQRKLGSVPPGYFHHGVKICRKVITENVSWMLLEPYWRGVYYQLQANELQKEVLNVSKIKHLFSYYCCVIA